MTIRTRLKSYYKLILLFVAIAFNYAYIGASENAQIADDILAKFDKANNAQQKRLAQQFIEMLNNEDGFFETPYSMPEDWDADSIRAEVWYRAGQFYFFEQDYPKGIKYSEMALPLLQKGKDTEKIADCMSYLSSSYFRYSDFANAIKYGKSVLEIDKKSGNKSAISSDLSNIAAIYLASKRPQEALPYALEAIENSTIAGDSIRMAIQMGMASEIYQSLNDNEKALAYAKQAYDIEVKKGRVGKVAIRLCQMAAPLMAMGEYEEAEEHLLKALPILEEVGNKQSYSIACNQLGKIALAKKDLAKAATYFNKALPFFVESGDFFNESKSQEGLFESLKQSNPTQALTHLERFCMLKDSIYHDDMQAAISEHNAKYKNEELRLSYEYETRLKNTILWISIPIILLAIGFIILLLYINRERKQKHDIIKQAEQMRTNFFTNITHEFRTPLTVIQSAAQDLMRSTAEDSDTYKNASNIIVHGQGLLNLINQILDIAKMTSGIIQEFKWTHGDIVEFINILCESYQAYATNKGVSLIYAPQEESVEMDFVPDHIQKIVQNLVSNAIKFSNPHAQVYVTTRRDGHKLQLYVSDTGIGMTAQQKENIFKPFYQAANDTANIGTGIGLSLVKLAVEKMNGTIEVHSIPNEGSVFVVTLPITSAASENGKISVKKYIDTDIVSAASIGNAGTLPKDYDDTDNDTDNDAVRILVVEDTPEVAHYISKQLNSDYHYYFAANGEDALQKAEQLVPDLIITDIMMPGVNGFELCKIIRSSELLNHIPVIMVTAKATREDRLQGLEVGADAYLEKPFHADELNILVEKLLEQRRLLREKYSKVVTESNNIVVLQDDELATDANRAFLAKVTDAVNEELKNGKLDYDHLAYKLALSRAQLNRKIKAVSGFTTTEFILQTRLAIAKQLLDMTDLSIWEVGARCGMDNHSYFCTVFKKNTGMSPIQYRSRKK